MHVLTIPRELIVDMMEHYPHIVAAMRGTCREWRAAATTLACMNNVTPELLVPCLFAQLYARRPLPTDPSDSYDMCDATAGRVSDAFWWLMVPSHTDFPSANGLLTANRKCEQFAESVLCHGRPDVAARLLGVREWCLWLFPLLCCAKDADMQRMLQHHVILYEGFLQTTVNISYVRAVHRFENAARAPSMAWGSFEALSGAARARNGPLLAVLIGLYGGVTSEVMARFACDAGVRRDVLANPTAVVTLQHVALAADMCYNPCGPERRAIIQELALLDIGDESWFHASGLVHPDFRDLFFDKVRAAVHYRCALADSPCACSTEPGFCLINLVHNRNALARSLRLVARTPRAAPMSPALFNGAAPFTPIATSYSETYTDADGNTVHVLGVPAGKAVPDGYAVTAPVFPAGLTSVVRVTPRAASGNNTRRGTRRHGATSASEHGVTSGATSVRSQLHYSAVLPHDLGRQNGLLYTLCSQWRIRRSPRLCAMLMSADVRVVAVHSWNGVVVGYLCMWRTLGPRSMCFLNGQCQVTTTDLLSTSREILHDVRALAHALNTQAIMSEEGMFDITAPFRDEWILCTPAEAAVRGIVSNVPVQIAVETVDDAPRAEALRIAIFRQDGEPRACRLKFVSQAVALGRGLHRLSATQARRLWRRHLTILKRKLALWRRGMSSFKKGWLSARLATLEAEAEQRDYSTMDIEICRHLNCLASIMVAKPY